MLPPRAEMEKLEDDILKQVRRSELFHRCFSGAAGLLLPMSMALYPPALHDDTMLIKYCAVCLQMHESLDKHNGSSILMLPTHVLKLPTG